MSAAAETAKPTAPDQGEQMYLFVCLVALLVMLVALLQRGEGTHALFPVLLGLGGVVLRWRVTSFLMLVTLGGVLLNGGQGANRTPAGSLIDMVLGASVLAFVAGSYRMLSMSAQIFPRDPRRRGLRSSVVELRKRSHSLVTTAELALLLGALPFWAGLAHYLYPEPHVDARGNPQDVPRWVGENLSTGESNVVVPAVDAVLRSRRLIVGIGGLLLTFSTVLGYLAWRRMTAAEAALVIQDVGWTESRGEQRRITRWAAWGRLRQSRREERS